MAVLNSALAGAVATGKAAAALTAERRTGHAPASLNHPLAAGDAPRKAVNVDLTELLDTITDELSMCLRYHQSLFRDRSIDRAIFVGGEARQAWLCQHVVKVLRVPAQMGDPLARLDTSHAPTTPGLTLGHPQPGWAVVCGLCTAPADL
jgi:Tfp pilus assembly PilM family ATPase